MASRLPKANSDINAWITLNDYFRSLNEYIYIQQNGDNPPTIKQYTKFSVFKTDTSYTISTSVATGNNEYGVGDNIEYPISEAIFEDGGDQTFTWGSGNFPTQSTGTVTYYLYCSGSQDVDQTTIGEGSYGASTNAPTFDYEKMGAYSTDGRVLASFLSSSTVVSQVIPLELFPENPTNDIINGAFDIWQRGISFTSISSDEYFVDRFSFGQGASTAIFSINQSTDVPSNYLNFSSLLSIDTKSTVVASGDNIFLQGTIEGFNFKKYINNFGSLGFFVKSNSTGIYCVAFLNSNGDMSYVTEYSINSNNKWEYIEIPPVFFDVNNGTWDFKNGIGLKIIFTLVAGTGIQTQKNSWVSGTVIASTNQSNLASSTSNVFSLTGVSFNKGCYHNKFNNYNINEEITRCQRYYEKTYNSTVVHGTNTGIAGGIEDFGNNASNLQIAKLSFKASKRTSPTVAVYDSIGTTNSLTLNGGSTYAAPTSVFNNAENGFAVLYSGANRISFHWTADAEL